MCNYLFVKYIFAQYGEGVKHSCVEVRKYLSVCLRLYLSLTTIYRAVGGRLPVLSLNYYMLKLTPLLEVCKLVRKMYSAFAIFFFRLKQEF